VRELLHAALIELPDKATQSFSQSSVRQEENSHNIWLYSAFGQRSVCGLQKNTSKLGGGRDNHRASNWSAHWTQSFIGHEGQLWELWIVNSREIWLLLNCC
jgi:hypothetical protein